MACCDSLNTKCNEIVTIGYIEELITSGTGTTGNQLIQSSADCDSYLTVNVNAVKQKMAESCCGLSQNDYKSYAPTYSEIISGAFIPYYKDGSGAYPWFLNQDGLYVDPTSYNGVNYDGSNKNSCCAGGTALVRKENLKVVYTRCDGYSEQIASSAGTSVCGGNVTFGNTLTLKKEIKSLNCSNNTYSTSSSTVSYNNVYDSSYVHVTGGTGNTMHFNVNGELPTSEECISVETSTNINTVNRKSAMVFRGCECKTSSNNISQQGTNFSIQWEPSNCDDTEDYISYEGGNFTAATISSGNGYSLQESGLSFTISTDPDDTGEEYYGDENIYIDENGNIVIVVPENSDSDTHYIRVYIKMKFCGTMQTYSCMYCQGFNYIPPEPEEASMDCGNGIVSPYPIAYCGTEPILNNN